MHPPKMADNDEMAKNNLIEQDTPLSLYTSSPASWPCLMWA